MGIEFLNVKNIVVRNQSSVPKYKQIISFFISKIRSKEILPGTKIPSINEVSFDKNISRDTVEKAYNFLKKIGIIISVKGIGHFVNSKSNKTNTHIKGNEITYNIDRLKILKTLLNSISINDYQTINSIYDNDLKHINPNDKVLNKKERLSTISAITLLFDKITFKKIEIESIYPQFKQKTINRDQNWTNLWTTFNGIGKFSKKRLSVPIHISHQWVGNKIIKEIQLFNTSFYENEFFSKKDLFYFQKNKFKMPSVEKYDSLKKIINTISKNKLGATIVTAKNKIIGIITDGDIRRIIAKKNVLSNISAINFMTKNPLTMDYTTRKSTALKLMLNNKINHLILTNKKGAYLGITHILDLSKDLT
ncbi:MAG: CBS domain-containing protein [Flavobacteriaceae bacterium]|nr:CBS domain-containing protein [Flavobacteriaceae bacterium]